MGEWVMVWWINFMRTVMMKKENRIGVDAMRQVRDIVPVE